MNKDCNICEGKGHYEVANYRLEQMEWVECMDCLLQEQYKEHITEQLADLLTKSSKHQLALIVSTFTINQMDKNENDDIARLEGMIQTKNFVNAIHLAKAYAGE
jgi:peroxiredoxin family protein